MYHKENLIDSLRTRDAGIRQLHIVKFMKTMTSYVQKIENKCDIIEIYILENGVNITDMSSLMYF